MSTYEISKSSLLSLKAEILKKQEELRKTKLENKVPKVGDLRRPPLNLKNKGVENRSANDVTEEEENLLTKSKACLEAKAKLYDKLKDGGANEDTNRKYLVSFEHRSEVMPNFDDDEDDKAANESEDELNEDDYQPDNSDDEWIEYTDCLGRTRTCLKKDLSFLKKKDDSLRDTVEVKNDNNVKETRETEKEIPVKKFDVESELLSGDMRKELQRQQWEKEEEELTKKTNVHYQDILFNEARVHGTGYYAFSKDEDERAKQQEALRKLRQETQQQQKQAQNIKKNREKQLKTRILAAKNRKRARMGLPPLTSDDEEEKEKDVDQVEKLEEKPIQIPEDDLQQEKEKDLKRKRHVRPWDLGKKGVKEHYEYSQEEWVLLQRKKREDEFAPPRTYNSQVQDLNKEEHSKGLYFSSRKEKNNPPVGFEKKKIVNELSDTEEEDNLMKDYHMTHTKGAAVPPPATYDYYGPSSAKRSTGTKRSVNMEDSIMQGLRYLRNKVEKSDS